MAITPTPPPRPPIDRDPFTSTSASGYEPSLSTGIPTQAIVKPGWTTTQGQFTAFFTVVALVLSSIMGYRITGGHVQNVWDAGVTIVGFVGPLFAALKQLMTYTNSRGMNYSNAAWASAAIQNPLVRNGGLDTGLMGDILGHVLGGKDWKDPQRYVGIAETVSRTLGNVRQGDGKVVERGQGEVTRENFDTLVTDFISFKADVQQGMEILASQLKGIVEAQTRIDHNIEALKQKRLDPTKADKSADNVLPHSDK